MSVPPDVQSALLLDLFFRSLSPSRVVCTIATGLRFVLLRCLDRSAELLQTEASLTRLKG